MHLSSYFFKFRIKKRNIGSDALTQRIQDKKEEVRTEAAACEVSRKLQIIQRIKYILLQNSHLSISIPIEIFNSV